MSTTSPIRPDHKVLAALRAPLILATLSALPAARAQDPAATPPPAPSAQSPAQPPDQTPDAGGPAIDNGPIVIPKKKESEEPPPPPAPAQPTVKNPNGETFSLRVDVPVVDVDVSVILDKNHQFIPGLTKDRFL